MKRLAFRPTQRTRNLLLGVVGLYAFGLLVMQMPGVSPVVDECALAVDIARQTPEGVFHTRLKTQSHEIDCGKAFHRAGVPAFDLDKVQVMSPGVTIIRLGRARLATLNLFARDVVTVVSDRACGSGCSGLNVLKLKRRNDRWVIIAHDRKSSVLRP
ncbi:MAG: hypothetical protein QM667_04295 [Asticcacaulis sp.]